MHNSCGGGNIKSQTLNAEYQARLNYIFEKVDRTKVTTGLLSDYGAHSIMPEYYNGAIHDSNGVEVSVLKSLYAGMETCKFNANASAMPSYDAFFNQLELTYPSDSQPPLPHD